MQERHEPLRTGRFTVEVDGVEVSGFRVVDIPARSTSTTEYREGKDPDHHRKLWGQTEYEDLEMERGARKGDTTLFDWRKSVEQGKMEAARKDVTVKLQDETGTTQIRWEFTAGWPKRYDPPTLETASSGGEGDVATESVVIVYDEMKRTK